MLMPCPSDLGAYFSAALMARPNNHPPGFFPYLGAVKFRDECNVFKFRICEKSKVKVV